MARRLGASEHNLLVMQGNLASTYRGSDGLNRPYGCIETYTLDV